MAETVVKEKETNQAAETAAAKKTKAKADKQAYWSVGRRKTAIARIKMSLGNGEIMVNDKPVEEFADSPIKKMKILAPLAATDRQGSFDISIKVSSGGIMAQLDAIAMGIARALLQYDESLRAPLRAQNLLTRDPRMKERKKYGLKRARKAPQFSKR